MTDQERIARIEAKRLNPPQMSHVDGCPQADEFFNENEECECEAIKLADILDQAYRRRFGD